MLRQGAPSTNQDGNPIANGMTNSSSNGIDIQQELNRLEEMLLDSPRLPFSRRTLVDEEQILDQLDLIRLNLPTAFQEATQIVRQKQEILAEAEQYAREVIAVAEQQAAQIMDEMGIVRQAEMQAEQIRRQVQQECETVRNQTIDEIERARNQARDEVETMQQSAIAEQMQIQQDADVYADQVLQGLEKQLIEVMRIIRNGRQQLGPDVAVSKSTQPKSLPHGAQRMMGNRNPRQDRPQR
ncbi:MAG: hypothetical protein ACTS2F_25770 [Thainema sp.]